MKSTTGPAALQVDSASCWIRSSQIMSDPSFLVGSHLGMMQTPRGQVIRRKSPSRPKKKEWGCGRCGNTWRKRRGSCQTGRPTSEAGNQDLIFWGLATLSDWTILSTKQHDQSTIRFGSRTNGGGSKLNTQPEDYGELWVLRIQRIPPKHLIQVKLRTTRSRAAKRQEEFPAAPEPEVIRLGDFVWLGKYHDITVLRQFLRQSLRQHHSQLGNSISAGPLIAIFYQIFWPGEIANENRGAVWTVTADFILPYTKST